MQNHQPRAPRFDLNLAVRFFSTDGLATGHCVNVSATGMLAAFDRPVDFWLEGELDFFIEDQHFSIKARIVRSVILDAGLLFHIDSDADKLTIEKLLKFAGSQE